MKEHHDGRDMPSFFSTFVRTLPIFCLPFLFSSCITFEGQTLTYRHDTVNDRLLIFQVYENIHCTGNTDGSPEPHPIPDKSEIDQLSSVMRGQRTFFFANWIFEYNRDDWLKPRERDNNVDGREHIEKQTTMFSSQLVSSVSVKNGDFYLNTNGQLCAYQYVSVTGLSSLITFANRLVGMDFAAKLSDASETPGFDGEALKRIKDVIQAQDWMKITGNEIRFRYVSTNDFYSESVKKHKEGSKEMNGALLATSSTYDFPVGSMTFGKPDTAIVELAWPPSAEPKINLIAHVKETYGIRKNVPIRLLRENFLRTGTIPAASVDSGQNGTQP